MTRARLLASFVCGAVLLAASSLYAAAEDKHQEIKLEPSAFETLLAKIHRTAQDEEWLKPGWKDESLTQTLTTLVTEVNQATKRNLTLPVDLAALRPTKWGDRVPENSLCFLQGGSVTRASKCVLFVDGNLRVTFADNCVIIARGAVNISHSSRNIVLAGHSLDISHDGGRDDVPSLLMSGVALRVSISTNSICYSPRYAKLSIATKAVFLNSPNRQISIDRECENVNDVRLSLAPALRANPLAGKLKITQVVGGGVVFERHGVEYFVRLGKECVDHENKPLADLAGWKLSYAASEIALFSKGHEDACFHLSSR